MASAMTGPHTAAAEIRKITAMIAHDHQSLSVDIGLGVGAWFVLAFTWRTFVTVNLSVRRVAMALRRSHPYEKCDGRDQDCARDK
jgi:hypothetical protein